MTRLRMEIQMRTFEIGDRVYHNTQPNAFGTVVEVSNSKDFPFCHVVWEVGNHMYRAFGRIGSTHPNTSLRLCELKYDPMQQGDTDEDI